MGDVPFLCPLCRCVPFSKIGNVTRIEKKKFSLVYYCLLLLTTIYIYYYYFLFFFLVPFVPFFLGYFQISFSLLTYQTCFFSKSPHSHTVAVLIVCVDPPKKRAQTAQNFSVNFRLISSQQNKAPHPHTKPNTTSFFQFLCHFTFFKRARNGTGGTNPLIP